MFANRLNLSILLEARITGKGVATRREHEGIPGVLAIVYFLFWLPTTWIVHFVYSLSNWIMICCVVLKIYLTKVLSVGLRWIQSFFWLWNPDPEMRVRYHVTATEMKLRQIGKLDKTRWIDWLSSILPHGNVSLLDSSFCLHWHPVKKLTQGSVKVAICPMVWDNAISGTSIEWQRWYFFFGGRGKEKGERRVPFY